jgi:bis(5'-nucleosyl)-tetraphosphatase (symmetrical)
VAVYAIGDVQGCYEELQRLLERLRYDPAADRLWFCGDLVNRGPRSLEVLRFVRSLGDLAVTVLGNHDLHLLAIAAGNERKKEDASLDAVLDAPDRDELLDWLRHRPLMYADDRLGFCLIHAGLPPQWDKAQALACASEVEGVLRDDQACPGFLADMYGNRPARWSGRLRGMNRLRFITNCFTRLRYCDLEGNLGLNIKGPPGSQGVRWLPWFKIPGRRSSDTPIVFGHWSTLGYTETDNVWALDTGCLWGGSLTALAVDGQPPAPLHLKCAGALSPG